MPWESFVHQLTHLMYSYVQRPISYSRSGTKCKMKSTKQAREKKENLRIVDRLVK
jgi:hypothetical protein